MNAWSPLCVVVGGVGTRRCVQVLIIGGGIANFTDVAKTFKVCAQLGAMRACACVCGAV